MPRLTQLPVRLRENGFLVILSAAKDLKGSASYIVISLFAKRVREDLY
jgi:hypothetical protein